ncbi:hypothetical protein RJ639_041119 [Escallonia herrerae]|uniref:Uncharacterized protein n=1 Tax=Escallonia herrerae TaxID=1293975 RepID=A0AA89B5T8_9ASTE|nr:hypothetical protein RJ639_041119 [Escallonia herrerae]
MAEIVVAEPSGESSSSSRRAYTTTNARPFTRSITSGRDYVPEPFDSEKLPVALVSEIQRFLRVANLIELEQPRVAYLCRFHAFEVTHNLDRNSSGRGVRQFKMSLLQRLEQDEVLTISRREKSDIRELRRVYREYKQYILKYSGVCNLENRERLNKVCAVASVLSEVLCTVTDAAGSQTLADTESTRAKSDFYVPYNILPFDQGGVHQAIMQLLEIKVAVASVRNIRGLPFLEDFRQHVADIDLFDWLQICFGFQMAYELHGMLIGDISIMTGEKVMPAYGGGPESFLNNVVTPFYSVIYEFVADSLGLLIPALYLQAMIIMATHDLESPLQVFDATILEDIMNIFITSAVLKLIQAILDIVFTWKARCTMDSTRSKKYVLKVYSFLGAVALKQISISYNFKIKPLIAPTRQIVKIGVKNYDWHELFPKVKSIAGAVVAIWSPPIILVSETEKNSATKFVFIWNQIITSFCEEDLISNREVDLMKIPSPSEFMAGLIRWPVFLLANKVAIALSIAEDFVGKDSTLLNKIKKDDYMYFAVKECYESLKHPGRSSLALSMKLRKALENRAF